MSVVAGRRSGGSQVRLIVENTEAGALIRDAGSLVQAQGMADTSIGVPGVHIPPPSPVSVVL
jgi:hypothetical protein